MGEEPAVNHTGARQLDLAGRPRRRLTGLDAGFVLQLVAAGALALKLAVGRGHGRGAVRADAGVPVARLGQTEEAARPIGAGVVAWWGKIG